MVGASESRSVWATQQRKSRPDWKAFALPWLLSAAIVVVLLFAQSTFLPSRIGLNTTAMWLAPVVPFLVYFFGAVMAVLVARSTIVRRGPSAWLLAGVPGPLAVGVYNVFSVFFRSQNISDVLPLSPVAITLLAVLLVAAAVVGGSLLGGALRRRVQPNTDARF